ncbi:MAG TPA: hypothetical protein VF204_16740 [Streptosporangiaceae bacterium]
MRVLLGEPAGWYLLEASGELYLDVNCNQSAVGFGILVRLDPAEGTSFAARGRAFAAELAGQIAGSPRTYWPRNVTGPLQNQVHEAIMTHQRETGTGPAR